MLRAYENRKQPILSSKAFFRRVIMHAAIGGSAIAIALGIGVAGYHWIGGLPWIDSLLNASMILGGMGPVDQLSTSAAKLFASFYALFSGLFMVGAASLMLAPFLHRMMHRIHME